MPEWLKRENKALQGSQGGDMHDGCYNSGVVVFDKADSGIWAPPPKPFPISHCQEQNWINRVAFATGRVHSLSPRWNYQWWINPTFADVAEAHFIHVSGLHSKREFLLPLLRALALR